MKSLKKYLIWNSGRSFSRQIRHNQQLSSFIHEDRLSSDRLSNNDPLIQNIIEWNRNGSLFVNFQYNHLQTIFNNNNGSQLFDLFNSFNYCPSKLLSYAKYAPQTNEGNELLKKLMEQYANIGDYKSCLQIFEWISDDLQNKIISIDYYNTLLKCIYNDTNHDNNQIIQAWDIWCDIKKSPISFNENTVYYLLNILQKNKNHLKQFIDELFTNYNSVISIDFNIINYLLPFINDINIAFKTYQDNVHLNPTKLSLSMLQNLINNHNLFHDDFNLLNKYIMEILNNYSTKSSNINTRNIRLIGKELTHICLLPIDKRQKYKFDDPENILSIFENEIINQKRNKYDNGYINFLLDNNISNMDDIYKICNKYGDAFNTNNLYNLVDGVINTHKLSNQLNTNFVSFVLNKNKQLLDNMSFNDTRISLKLLSILNKNIVNNDMGQFISMIESIQKRMIYLFESNKKLLSSEYSKFGHKCIIYNIDEIIGIISAFTKYRMYNEPLMNFLSEQIVVNIFKNNPRHSSSIIYFDKETKKRSLENENNINIIMPIYTTILRHMRYLNYHQNKLYGLIASSLQKRPDWIKIEELREWCLTFGAMNHTSNSIWLSIQSVILYHYPTNNDILNNMSMDMLIDFVWSMSILDLIPNYWLMPDLITMINDINNRQLIENLSFIHKTRLWEIFQSLYASPTCYQSLNLIDKDVIDALHGFYDQYVLSQFHQQCKLRPSIIKFCKYLNSKHIKYEIGTSVGNMIPLCDIIIPEYKLCIEIFDYPHITKRSQNRTREWVKFTARREISRRIIDNTQKNWNCILLDSEDENYDINRFNRLINRLIHSHNLKHRINDQQQQQQTIVYDDYDKDLSLA